MSRRIRIIHVINSFEPGGAETMLCNLVLRTDRERFETMVVALINDLTLAAPLRAAGVPVHAMGMRPGVPDPRGFARLVRHLRRHRPHVVQTWMDHSNLIGGLAARAAGQAMVVWGIHHSNHLPHLTKRSTLLTVGACARLSGRLPAKVICCSEHSRKLYAERGFSAQRLVVIPNGFDTNKFRPDPQARQAVRRELGVGEQHQLIGLAARYHPFKDHATFLKAAALLAGQMPQARFVLFGAGAEFSNPELSRLIDDLRLRDRCHLLGMRRDVPRIFAALDLSASSSVSEAFPLAVGESMSCGVPCVATDVGDSALIIGSTGRIVLPQDPRGMADAWHEVLSLAPEARAELGACARRRICKLFDLDAVTQRYEELYRGLLKPPVASAPRSPTTAEPVTAF